MADHIQIYATDNLLERNRSGRALFAIACLFSLGALLLTVPWLIAKALVGYGPIGFAIGGGVFITLIVQFADRFIVNVDSYSGFLTTNGLAAMFDRHSTTPNKSVYVPYGPGWHFSYPWESRSADRNVSLEEIAENFEISIQTKTGAVTMKGSVRFRPDITLLVNFLGGVATVAGDSIDLIKSFLLQKAAGKSVDTVLNGIDDINTSLKKEFVHGEGAQAQPVTEFEQRFGINFGDITVSEIILPDAMQKTRNAADEIKAVMKNTAVALGFSSMKAFHAAVQAGTVSDERLKQALDRVLAASENINMELKAIELNGKLSIEGLDPEAIKNLAPILPALAERLMNRPPRKTGKGANKKPQAT